MCVICAKVIIQVGLWIAELNGVVYRVKSKGPKTEPWGTPLEVGSMSEKQLSIFVRYEKTQLRAVPDMPYHLDNRLIRMPWSIMSKVAHRSRSVSAVTLPVMHL